MRLRIERVTDIPHGGLAVVRRKAGTQPVVQLNARLITEDQAHQFGCRLRKDPDLLRSICDADV
jgi:hypothetical protein